MIDFKALLPELLSIAAEAGRAILSVYDSDFAVELKDDRSPLTAADRAAHTTILAGLKRLSPELPVLSEESPPEELAGRRSWQRFWLVDPLDGTREFIKRNGEFTVNIALIDSHRPVAGVVAAPALGRTYYGAVGHGAFRQDGAEPRPIGVRRPAADPLRIVGSRSHGSPDLESFLATIGPHVLKPMGSSLKICLVAEGEADLYPRLGLTSEWDTAAAEAVLLAAGGSMIDLKGQPLTYNAREGLLNPHFLALGDDISERLPGLRNGQWTTR
jgi:3'(2'), 5'-bisphosphate nucleotidase